MDEVGHLPGAGQSSIAFMIPFFSHQQISVGLLSAWLWNLQLVTQDPYRIYHLRPERGARYRTSALLINFASVRDGTFKLE